MLQDTKLSKIAQAYGIEVDSSCVEMTLSITLSVHFMDTQFVRDQMKLDLAKLIVKAIERDHIVSVELKLRSLKWGR